MIERFCKATQFISVFAYGRSKLLLQHYFHFAIVYQLLHAYVCYTSVAKFKKKLKSTSVRLVILLSSKTRRLFFLNIFYSKLKLPILKYNILYSGEYN